MSPARAPRGKGGARRRRRGVPVVLVLLGIVAAGACGLALYFGFLPGPGSLFGTRGAAALLGDSALASAVAGPAGTVPATPALDTALAVSAPAPDSISPVTSADSAAGDALYHGIGRCVGCHGALGEGAPGLGPDLRTSPGRLDDGTVPSIARLIAGGAPPAGGYRIAMPSYAGQLSADDVTRVAAYVHTLSHPGATADSALVPTAASAPIGTTPAPTVPRANEAGGAAVNADAPPRVRHPTVPAPPAAPAPRRP